MLNILAASVTTSQNYTCGSIGFSFSGMLPYIVSMLVLLIKIVVPILLVIFGMLDLGKAVMAQKEDEIKKGQLTLIKRVVAAIIVFFVVSIVSLVIGFVSSKDDKIMSCFNCFITGDVAENACTLEGGTQGGM